MKDVKVNLTAEEWMALIDAEDGELQQCCANISTLRDHIIALARAGGRVDLFTGRPLLYAYVVGLDGHDLTGLPTLAKLIRQVEAITGVTVDQLHHGSEREVELHLTTEHLSALQSTVDRLSHQIQKALQTR